MNLIIRSRRSDQRGAAAVEFALVFPILFMLVYGGIAYAIILIFQQALNFAAQEAAQAAVAVNPQQLSSGTTTAYNAAIQSKANSVVTGTGGLLAWMPSSLLSQVTVTASVVAATGTGAATPYSVQVQLTMTGISTGCGAGGGLLPSVCLPLLGAAPPLPTSLSATAVVGI